MITITPRQNFTHAGGIPARFDTVDPRQALPQEECFRINLRECQFIWPPAVLWCAIFPLLARSRSAECELVVPQNMGVCRYLVTLGLFDILKKAGVAVDDRGIRASEDPQLVLPLTRLETEYEVEELTNQASNVLAAKRLGAANLRPLVSNVFAELALNAVQHAESPIGAFGLVQFYSAERGDRFVCAVADGGIGIRRSLERNPALRDRVPYDWVAVELALRERVSRTGDSLRGIGLYDVAEDMRRADRQLIIHSGIGSVRIGEQLETRVTRTRLFPGTLGYGAIPT